MSTPELAPRAFLAMWWFQLRQLSRNSYFVQLCLTVPLVFLAIKWMAAAGSGTSLDSIAGWQAAIAGVWSLTATSCGIIGFQRFQGVLEQQALSARGPAAAFLPVVLAGTGLGLFAVPVAYVAAAVLGAVPEARRPVWLAVSMLAVFAACAASACVIAAFFVLSKRALVFEELLVTPVWLLAGVVTAWNSLPVAVRPIALISPLTGAVEAVRDSAQGEGSLIPWILTSVVTSGLWLVAAKVGLRIALRRACVVGSLGLS
jgi:ABC-2 type transport system permease protein